MDDVNSEVAFLGRARVADCVNFTKAHFVC